MKDILGQSIQINYYQIRVKNLEKKNYNLLKKRVNTWGVLLWMVKWGLGLVLSKYNEVTINISFRR